MLGAFVRLLRVASIVACAIVVLAFIVFAADRTKTASGQQQEQISAVNGGGSSAPSQPSKHESGIHKALDEASSTLTSPFSGIVSSASSEWAEHGVRLLLALLVYGFGLGFLARTLRVRM
ncbi:MAG TPA: hypothetical protein VHT27_06515 [Solirubrobacteraceae bacterium]|nr:hypothetical protein [Solirubrobacteraceae bacterium]